MIDRISELIKKQGLSVRAFEQSIGASDGMIRRAINNGTDIQSKWISAIADNYPHINLRWLLTGQGDMLRANSKSAPTNENIKEFMERYEQLVIENNELKKEIGKLKGQKKSYTPHTPISLAAEP